jgi:glycosyltransferase involved in cell wall biosynthesis
MFRDESKTSNWQFAYIQLLDPFPYRGLILRVFRIRLSSPLLSICLPTYNRSKLLKEALNALAPQVENAVGVELVVSDNASTDDTPKVVRTAQRKWKCIKYHRNSVNSGLAGNFLLLTDKLARGKFCWIVGDDDIVRPGAVDRILDVLMSNSGVDFILLNKTVVNSNRRNGLRYFALKRPEPSRPDLVVEKWEMLIDPDLDKWFLTGMMCSVFRLSIYRKYKISAIESGHAFSRVDTTYPHSVTFAHTMIGKKSYYVGTPCILTFWGHQERNRDLPLVLHLRAQELLDLYEMMGVDGTRIEQFRKILLVQGIYALSTMLSSTYVIGREEFSIWRFIRRNRYHVPLLLETLVLFIVLPRVRQWIPSTVANKLVAKTRKRREAVIASVERSPL